jgi:hypothetical protein
VQKQLDAGKGQLKSLKRSIPGGKSAAAGVLHERVDALESWNGKARALLPLARTFLKLTPL